MVGRKFGELLLLNVSVKRFTLKKKQKKKIKNNFYGTLVNANALRVG